MMLFSWAEAFSPASIAVLPLPAEADAATWGSITIAIRQPPPIATPAAAFQLPYTLPVFGPQAATVSYKEAIDADTPTASQANTAG